MKMKKHGFGFFGQVSQGDSMDDDKQKYFIEPDPIKYKGVGIVEWISVLSVLGVILSALMKKF